MPLLIFAPELADVFACIALLLIAWAILPLLQRPLEQLFGAIPVIGTQMVQALDRGIAKVQAQATSWAKSGTDAIVQAIFVPLVRLSETVAQQVMALEGIATFAGGVPGAIGSVILQLYNTAVTLGSRITAQATALANLVTSLPGTVTTLAEHLIAQAVATVNATIHGVELSVSAAVSTAATALSQAIAAVDARIVAAERALSAVIAQESTAIRGVIDTDVRAINAELGQISAKVDPLVAAGLLTLVPAIAQELTTTIEECVTPTCSVITPQLGMLNALLNIGTIAAVGVLVGEAIHDPEAAAADVVGITNGIASAAESLLGAFVTGTA